jgi:hypothetical protein
MLSLSDRSLEEVSRALASRGAQAGYLVPTSTGIAKSILDAHGQLRAYLDLTGFHDFASQHKGEAHKIVREALFVLEESFQPTKVSLYRPETKSGDPRIWVYGLKDYAKAGNLLACIVHNAKLYVCNTSNLLSADGRPIGQFARLLVDIQNDQNATAQELLRMTRGVASRGWTQSLRAGPTGVGYTLESLLGIAANSRRTPDYKGIEIKAGRSTVSGLPTTRTTLFSKTPDWANSPIKSGLELLDKYGYVAATGRRQLYCSLSNRANSLGHYLELQEDEEVVSSMYQSAACGTTSKVLSWPMDILRQALKEKHRETFWVKAQCREVNGVEQFRYTHVVHTREPLLANLPTMIIDGKIELDYLLHEVIEGSRRRARDHGYLFKMWPSNIPYLFPPPLTYVLN